MAEANDNDTEEAASPGHKLGQLIGDWFEEFFVLPVLQDVAQNLNVFLDHRFKSRVARGDKLLWRDVDGNTVAYDFVMEIGGSEQHIGIPVAFFEGCWRRGKRHSKDKARDDSGKLLPMRDTFPTARFLGSLWAGDITAPASIYVRSRLIDLFYVPKDKVIAAFSRSNINITYHDRATTEAKAAILQSFNETITVPLKQQIAAELRNLVGPISLDGYTDRVKAALKALPQEIRIVSRRSSQGQVFETIADATTFLETPHFSFDQTTDDFLYSIVYTDGTEFERAVVSLVALRQLHQQIERLGQHLTRDC